MAYLYGELSGTGQTVVAKCVDDASAIISVSGTFTGRLTVTGAVTDTASEGERLLIQSGVGSIGKNFIDVDGPVNREFRCLTGGSSLIVRASNWTSGTAEVQIATSESPSLIFINGPVHNAEEEAMRAGRAFSANTGVREIASNQYLKYRFENPAGSGKRCFVYLRDFTNDLKGADAIPQSVLCINPNAIAAPASVTPVNLEPASGITSAVNFTWKVDATTLTGAVGSRFLSLNGIPMQLGKTVTRIVDPGQAFGYYIRGTTGGALASALNASMACVWYEESI